MRSPRYALIPLSLLIAALALVTGPAGPTSASASAAAGAAHVAVPAAAQPISGRTTRWVGTGTPASCTSKAVVRAVAKGGIIRFRCGPRPVTIRMGATAKVINNHVRVVLDGGGKVTLDGQGKRRILYMNTCDRKQIWTTDHCNDQRYPQLTLQHITLAHGFNGDDLHGDLLGGGGAVYARGGRLRIVDSTFIANRCRRTGPDVGGGAVRALYQYHQLPVYISGSSFRGGRCSNGAALSSIGVSWSIYNTVFRNNHAIGHGANPAAPGTPGGGSGGAIYLDGNLFTLTLAGTTFHDNVAVEGGGAVFFVSNDHTGTMSVRRSTLTGNPSQGFHNYPGTTFFIGSGQPHFTTSVADR